MHTLASAAAPRLRSMLIKFRRCLLRFELASCVMKRDRRTHFKSRAICRTALSCMNDPSRAFRVLRFARGMRLPKPPEATMLGTAETASTERKSADLVDMVVETRWFGVCQIIRTSAMLLYPSISSP